MVGNVFEWVEDCVARDGGSPQTAGKKASFPLRQPATTAALRARRVLIFERTDRRIARRDGQLIGIASHRGNWVRFVKPPESDAATTSRMNREGTEYWLSRCHRRVPQW